MPKVRQTLGLRDRACERLAKLTAASSERESGCYLHGVFPEEKIAQNPQGFLHPSQLLHS